MEPLKTYPAWIFDGSEIPDPFGYGERAVNFLKNLRHPKSKARGRAFQLDPFLERIVRRIYGPRHADGTRIVKNVFMMIPRGNRKTSIGAALTLLHTIGPEREPAGQVVCAAADQKQARIAFDEAASIIRQDKRLEKIVEILDYRNRIKNKTNGAWLEAISADGATQHGRTPAFVLCDELHAWKKRDLWEALKTGLVKTAGSLCVIITTAGRGHENVAFEQYDYARRVALGEIEDPATLPILFEAPRDCDWRDESIWHLVNPGLAHGYPDLEGLRQLAREAENKPAERESFRQLHLNIWLDHSADPFVDMNVYDKGHAPVDLTELEGRPCWLAVDLSSVHDLTAIIAAWRDDNDGFIVHPWFFCPADNLRAKAERDGVPYPLWAEQGFITPTPGNVIDYRAIESTIRDLCQRFDVREIAFDPHLAQQVMGPLNDDGFPVVAMRQGWVTMAPAIKELERAIVGGKFRHGGHPVLRWNFDNIAVETDKAGNKSFHKGKSRDRIDGAVASAMAVVRAAAAEDTRSIYHDISARPEGLLFI